MGSGPKNPRHRLAADLLDLLWEGYRARQPHVRAYEKLLREHRAGFRNDHAAFRSIAWQRPALGTFCVTRIFEALGFVPAACYEFPSQRLSAVHLRPPHPALPKIFVSQLKAWELSPAARAILSRAARAHRPLPSEADLARPRSAAALARFFTELPWPVPAEAEVRALARESQYGAWVLLHGYGVNHFTASINAHGPGPLENLEKTVAAMRRAGIPMKAEIEGARGSPLRQSSTEAPVLPTPMRRGGKLTRLPWTYAYFELAERRGGFQGFLGDQAANLFEMTRLKS